MKRAERAIGMQQQHCHPQVFLDFGQRLLVAFRIHFIDASRRQVGDVAKRFLGFLGQLLVGNRQPETTQERTTPIEHRASALGDRHAVIGQQQLETEVGIAQLRHAGIAQTIQRVTLRRGGQRVVGHHQCRPCRHVRATSRQPATQRTMQLGGRTGQ